MTQPRLAVPRLALVLAILCFTLPALADKKPKQLTLAGPRATALRITQLYVSADKDAEKVGRAQIGREMVVAEKSGAWMRVYINTDIEEVSDKDAPIFGQDEMPPPISGWIESKGIVVEGAPAGDRILMGAAADEESLASDPRGPANAAQSARLLYRRLIEMFPNSPLLAEASWREADILWQLEKADASTRVSAKEKDPYMREQMDEDELRKVIKRFPGSRQAALAAYELIDNKLCGDWEGQKQCPEKESAYYEKYADEYGDGPKTAQALYQAVYRQAVLTNMYAADGDDKKTADAHNHARELAARLMDKFPQTDSAWRAAELVYKLDEGVPVYGIDLQ